MTEFIGQQLGSYLLEALLAATPTGPLYSGRQLRLNRPAAVKLFAPALVARPGVQPRLLAALRASARVQHPNLAAIYDVDEEAGRLFVATELSAGGSLRTLMQPQLREATPLAVRLELLAQAADGLAAAHAAGLVHGAVKPESLWLEQRLEDGPPLLKLTDLGVAAALSEEALGAPAYLSPEQCRGLALDARADLYSLGVVLYELVVGVPPFNVQTIEAAVEKHLRTRPVPPRLVRPQLPVEVEAIALRCLAKNPAERFPDAAAFAAAVRQSIATLGPTTQGATPQIPAVSPQAPTLLVPVPSPDDQATLRVPEPIVAAPPPRVEVLGPQGALLRTAALVSGALTVGRAPDRDLFLDDQQISREHLRIDWDGRAATVTDLGSANGSFVGRSRLAPHVPTPWDGRQPLRVGPFSLRLAPPPGQVPADETALASPPPQPQPGRIELRIDQERLTLTPGAPILLPVRLTNTGAVAEELGLSVEGVPGAWLREADQQVLRLGPGAQAATSLTITVPRSPEALAGDYNVLVRARPLGGSAAGEARLRWTVLPYREAEIRIAPPSAESRAAADYQVQLRNLGNEPASYLLSFDDPDELLGYTLAQDELLLEPGQAGRVGLSVEAAGRLFGGPEERPFAVKADDGQSEPVVAEAQLVHLATLPPWVLAASLAALTLALLLGGWALFGGRGGIGAVPAPTTALTPLPPTLTPLPTPLPGAPNVVFFSTTPQIVAPGEPVLISWRVEGAERVFIEQFGDVSAEGQREFRPEQTTDFRLTAIAPGGRETVVIARVNVAPPTALPAPTETALPTLGPPTAVPPTTVPPTAVPPTAVPPTAVPPTAVQPTAVQPTSVPPGAPTVDLVAGARGAVWRTEEREVGFGRPFFGAGSGGWADVADDTLEDGQPYEDLLQLVPPVSAGTGPVAEASLIEGEYTLAPLLPGQIFVASVGFPQGAADQGVTVSVIFEAQILFQAVKEPDGTLLPIFVDLSALAGQGGRLVLQVAGNAPDGVYWVNPRVDVPR